VLLNKEVDRTLLHSPANIQLSMFDILQMRLFVSSLSYSPHNGAEALVSTQWLDFGL